MRKKREVDREKVKEVLFEILKLEIFAAIVIASFFLGKKAGTMQAEKHWKEELLKTEEMNAETMKEEREAVQALSDNQDRTEMNEDKMPEEAGIQRNPQKDRERLETLWTEHPELILVNKEYLLDAEYEPELKKLPDGTNRADVIAYDALCRMLSDGRKEGLNFEICSSYRSVKRQKELLEEDIRILMNQGFTYEEAYEEATRETMPPGCSEHATGLAFDIVALSYQMLDAHQQNTPEVLWLKENCSLYGFILRYPKEKEAVTGISYESWHFRYVGEEASAYITDHGITLEEYLEEYLNGNLDI